MKLPISIKRLLVCLLGLNLFACEDNSLIVIMPDILIVKKQAELFGQPVLEFQFFQEIAQTNFNEGNIGIGLTDSTKTLVLLENLGSQGIDTLSFYLEAFSQGQDPELLYVFQEALGASTFSDTLILSTTSFEIISQIDFQPVILRFNDIKHDLSGVYQGDFRALNDTNGVELIGLARAYISADGLLRVRLESNATTKQIKANISGDTLAIGEAFGGDTSASFSRVSNTSDTRFTLSGDTLQFQLELTEPSSTDNIKTLNFQLLTIN